MATYQELKAQAEALLEQAEEARREEISSVIADIRAKMDAYGITPDDLSRSRNRALALASGYRYRGPNGEGWSGRGRQPQWLKDAIAAGHSKDDFAI